MFTSDQYELIDFGDGRRLERFAGWVLDRPCPAAEQSRPMLPDEWDRVDARFERDTRTDDDEGDGWTLHSEIPETWPLRHGPFQMELRRSPFGHLGVFPEQASNWDWIAEQVATASGPLKILNLFAYTGGSTLAAATAGVTAHLEVEVVHVDSAGNTVARGKRNAELSGLAEAPIRWITEDAMKFVRREVKRGNRYDAVILDPPSYGHGRRGEAWRATKHLPELLAHCAKLTADRRHFMLLTCHTPDLDEKRLSAMLRDAVGDRTATITAGPLGIPARCGKTLSCGVFVRLV